MKSNRIVAVTGGTGFLGQHIVKHLHQCPLFNLIRVVDFNEYQQRLEFVPMKPVDVVKTDISNYEEVKAALKGVHTVIHTAGLVDVSMFPDVEKLHQINVTGTQNIIKASIKCNVESLIYTSSVDVAIGLNDINNGTETTLPPATLLWGEYATTKLIAEQLVRKVEGSPLENGSVLKTAVIRPNVMYGEGDPYFVTQGLKTAKRCFGKIPRVGSGAAKFQICYVGNVAWAHIKAAEVIMDKKAKAGGQAFYAPDDTPLMDTQSFMKLFLDLRGYSVSDYYIPFFVIYLAFLLFELLLIVLRPFFKVNTKYYTLKSMKQMNTTVHFSRKNAERQIGYKPVYSFEDAFRASATFYTNMPL